MASRKAWFGKPCFTAANCRAPTSPALSARAIVKAAGSRRRSSNAAYCYPRAPARRCVLHFPPLSPRAGCRDCFRRSWASRRYPWPKKIKPKKAKARKPTVVATRRENRRSRHSSWFRQIRPGRTRLQRKTTPADRSRAPDAPHRDAAA